MYRANCSALCCYGRLQLRALRDIAEGEELTTPYIGMEDAFLDRRVALREGFHFDVAPEVCCEQTFPLCLDVLKHASGCHRSELHAHVCLVHDL